MTKIITGEMDGAQIWREQTSAERLANVLHRDTELPEESHDCKLESDGHCECKTEPDDFSTSDNGTGDIR